MKYFKKHRHKSTDKLFVVFSTSYLTNYIIKEMHNGKLIFKEEENFNTLMPIHEQWHANDILQASFT